MDGPPDQPTVAAPSASPPVEENAGLRVGRPATTAGGLPAVLSTLSHLRRETGLVRGGRALLALNQDGGIDCPGCAWPEAAPPRGPLEFCENGAKAIAAEATTKRIGGAFFAAHTVAELAAQPDLWLDRQGRLTEPLVLHPGQSHYRPLTWTDALALIGHELHSLDGPDQATFYTSGRTSNEAAFLWQLFVRAFGTNNLPDCSNLCHESSGVGLKETIGVGKGTVQLEDFDLADAIFVVGQNPGTNHPRMLTTLRDAAERGCRIVSVNPLPEAAMINFSHPQDAADLLGHRTAISSLHVPVRTNGDVAFFQAVGKHLLEQERQRPGRVLDHAFLGEHTTGFEAYREHIEALAWSTLLDGCGLSRDQVRAAAEVILGARRVIVCWAMGITQHRNGVANVQEIVNVQLLRGNLGRPGAGLCPVRGHSNVQGDRTMGITTRADAGFLQRLGDRFRFTPPASVGLDTVDSIHAMLDGRVRALVALGGNFLSASPDTERTAQALRGCQLTVHVATKLNRSHLVTGRTAVILPCLGRTERDHGPDGPRFVTVEDSMGLVHRSQGTLPPASVHLRSEPAIVAGLARAVLGPAHPVAWESLGSDYALIRDAIAHVIPGFEDFEARVSRPGGFALPNPARERRWVTASHRASFTQHEAPRWDLQPGTFLMMTIRSHDQFNTTIYGLDDRYRGVTGGRRVVFCHADDMAQLGLVEGQLVDLSNHEGGHARTAARFRVVPYPIPRGCIATYFPEANALIPLEAIAHKSQTPASKSVVVTITPCA